MISSVIAGACLGSFHLIFWFGANVVFVSPQRSSYCVVPTPRHPHHSPVLTTSDLRYTAEPGKRRSRARLWNSVVRSTLSPCASTSSRSRQSFCLFCPAPLLLAPTSTFLALKSIFTTSLTPWLLSSFIHHVPRPAPAAVTGTLPKR